MQYKIPVAVIASAVVVAMLVATSGIIVSSQIAFAAAGGTGNPNSNVGGNGNGNGPATQPLKNGGVPGVSGPANGQGTCYGQGAGVGTGNTQIANAPGQGAVSQGNNPANPAAAPGGTNPLTSTQKVVRDTTCPASPGFPSGH